MSTSPSMLRVCSPSFCWAPLPMLRFTLTSLCWRQWELKIQLKFSNHGRWYWATSTCQPLDCQSLSAVPDKSDEIYSTFVKVLRVAGLSGNDLDASTRRFDTCRRAASTMGIVLWSRRLIPLSHLRGSGHAVPIESMKEYNWIFIYIYIYINILHTYSKYAKCK